MGGRSSYLWIMLGFTLSLVGSADHVLAVEPIRLSWNTPTKTNFSMWARELYQWQDGNETAHLLRGNVVIEHDGNKIEADEAIVWWDTQAKNRRTPVKVTVYAEGSSWGKGSTINKESAFASGKPTDTKAESDNNKETKAVLVDLTTPAIGRYGYELRMQSHATTPLFKRAEVARGRPQQAKYIEPVSVIPKIETTQFTKKDELPAPPPMKLPPPPANVVAPPNNIAPLPLLGEGPAPKAILPPPPAIDPPLIKGTTVIPVPLSESRTIWIAPRSTQPYEVRMTLIGKERVTIVTGGVKLLAKFTTGEIRSLQVEADQIVIWKKDGDSKNAVDSMTSSDGSDSNGIEFYLSGNVILRYGGVDNEAKQPGSPMQDYKTMRADRVYYDVDRHKAIASNADLEYVREGYVNKGHVKGQEIYQLGASEFQVMMAEIHASRLPSDPGLKLTTPVASIYKMPREQRRTIFGTPFRDRLTGELVEEDPQILETGEVVTRANGLPISWWPGLKTDVNDPTGPFNGVMFRQDRQFGFQTYLTWDALELIGLTKLPNEKWNLLTDYLSRRGPALGTDYSLASRTFMGMDAPFQTIVKGYLLYDEGTDIIGGPRSQAFTPPEFRGRFLFRHQQEFDDLTVQAQLAYLSDRNFHEQMYNFDYTQGPNQETFLWLKHQSGNAAVTLLTEPNIRPWISETQWLPKVEGHLIGQSFFDMFTYHTWGSVAYARSNIYRSPPTEYPLGIPVNSPPFEPSVNTGRLDWMHQLALPLNAGPAKIVPYGVADLAYYTSDTINRADQGRLYGGLGVRGSIPFSRLYRDVESELFNVQGLYHKNLFGMNYYYAASTTSHTLLPQLDRLNDDSTENAWRNITPWHPFFPQTAGADGLALRDSPIYNPRLYAIRRLVDSRPDTLDSVHVLQTDWRQRFQTKRGYPGQEHIVDWLTVDLSASIFPTPDRDNFGNTVGFLESNVVWNVGDKNAVFFNSWFDPFNFGANYYSIGTSYYRDDRTTFNLTYRSIDPVHSRLLVGTATYVFNPKYAITAATAYDFSSNASLTNSLFFTRIGTDMQVTIGFTYNSLLNNFGINLNIMPNLTASQTATGFGQSSFGGLGGNQFTDRR